MKKVALSVVLIILVLFFTACGKNADSPTLPSKLDEATEYNSDDVGEDSLPTALPDTAKKEIASEPTTSLGIPEKSTDESENDATSASMDAETETNENVQYNPVKSFEIKYITDYVHIDSDTISLGNNEGVTITLTAMPSGLSTDDFLFYYDESMLSVNIGEAESDTDKDRTTITVVVRAIKPGTSELIICSNYELETLGEQAGCYELSIRGLDFTDGRIVYVTSSGEKYHLSKECAGDNYIETTMRDALAYEYEPCGKCAK